MESSNYKYVFQINVVNTQLTNFTFILMPQRAFVLWLKLLSCSSFGFYCRHHHRRRRRRRGRGRRRTQAPGSK